MKNIRPPTLVAQFNLFVDKDGILRARSRLKHASLTLDATQPILLPKNHWYSRLVVQDYHERVFHSGVRETLNALRNKYWIFRGREVVKSCIKPCIICKKLEGLPFSTVQRLDLPAYRVEEGPPFLNVGLDFAGPLYVSHSKDNIQCKVYVCLFTCLSTRAIHLELVECLDVETFYRAFRRCCSRRGTPKRILSDNTKTFHSASKEVKNAIFSKLGVNRLKNQVIVWQFIAQRAAFWGGTWERMVRSIKRCLRKNIGRSSLNVDELNTLLIEVESVINSRPITYLYDDQDGISCALSPSHLIYGRRIIDEPNEELFEIVSTQESLTCRAKYHRHLLREFMKRRKREYLLGLREVASTKKLESEPYVSVGDVVLVYDEQTKRNFWKTCKIDQLIIGSDGHVRAAKIKVPTKSGTTILTRSLKHLIPLEVKASEVRTEPDSSKCISKSIDPEQSDCSRRPQ